MRLTASVPAVVVLCALALARCGGGGGGGNANASSGPDDEARLKFAECMRAHGIDVPDPQPGGGPIQLQSTRRPGSGGGPDSQAAIGGAPIDDPNAEKAMKACQDELGDAAPQPPSAQERQEAQDAALRFAQCMRDNGVDMPDPKFSDGPGGGFLIQQEGGAETDSPAFRKAQKACQDELPEPPGEGPGSSG